MRGVLVLLLLSACGRDPTPFVGPYPVEFTMVLDTCNEPGTVVSDFEDVWVVSEADLSENSKEHFYYLFPMGQPDWVMESTDGKNFHAAYFYNLGFGARYSIDHSAQFKFKEHEKKQTMIGLYSAEVYFEDGISEPFECGVSWDAYGYRSINRE